MVGREHPLSILRQMFQSLATDAKEQTHQYSIHGVKKPCRARSDRTKRLEPLLLFLIEYFVRVFERIDRFAFAAFCDFAQEIAHSLDPRDRLLAQFHSARFSDFERQIQPFE